MPRKNIKRISRLSLSKSVLILGFIIVLALFIRTYKLSSVPSGFHRDEALFGYEAYSLLKTGRDQHGRFLPLSFEGFGIPEYPIAFYLKVPFVALLGLNVFSIRFSVVFVSLITIFLIYKIGKAFFESESAGLLSAFLLATSSWHFFMSRAGYSIGMYGLLMLLLGTWLLFLGKSSKAIILGGVFLGLTCFSYASYFFFLPPYLLFILWIFFDRVKNERNFRVGLIAAFLTMIVGFLVFLTPNLIRAPQAAFFYNDPGIVYFWSDKPVGEIFAQGGKYNAYEKWLHYPRLAYVYKAGMNYFQTFSPTFWLEKGRGFESNVDGFGNLLIYEPFLILVGAIYVLWKRSKYGLFVVVWVFLGPLPTMFTKELASTRLLHMVAPFVLLEALGVKFLFDYASKFKPKILGFLGLALLGIVILFINVLYYDAYFRHLNVNAGRWWQNGYMDIVRLTNKYPDKQVYFKGAGDFAYIFVLFENKFDPRTFQTQAKRQVGDLNISYVLSFSRYHFIDFDKADFCRDYNSIYIEKLEDNAEHSFTPSGEIKYLGSDRFDYFIPTKEQCDKFSGQANGK